jgi:prolyl-tRNA synthetase
MAKVSQICWKTEKHDPKDAELVSHKLMLRAGLIYKVSSGVYSWLPMGLKVLRKVENIVRNGLDEFGVQEMLMPMVQPASLWKETNRWQKYGPELLRLQDRHNRDFCLGPTHEEVVTDWARNYFNSYKQLPACVYQIQTKFRDEIRPRFGVMRAREFVMKDAYSFHFDQDCLNKQYDLMKQAYSAIFDKMGLQYKIVEADSGSIGGNKSHEFQVLSTNGEDSIVYCEQSDYAANIEQAISCMPEFKDLDFNNCEEKELVQDFVSDIKTYLIDDKIVVVLCAKDELNPIQLAKHKLIKSNVDIVIKQESVDLLDCKLPILVDADAACLAGFTVFKDVDRGWSSVYWKRDIDWADIGQFRLVKEGDISPCGKGVLKITKGIEVGHIFQLGDNYSAAMKAEVLGADTVASTMLMGCYGIGISRIVAAAIEQSHDEKGIIWPASLSPFHVHIVVFNSKKDSKVSKVADDCYESLSNIGYDVLYDDRNIGPGVMLADADLLGVTWRIVVSARSIEQGGVELKNRASDKVKIISTENLIYALQGVGIE